MLSAQNFIGSRTLNTTVMKLITLRSVNRTSIYLPHLLSEENLLIYQTRVDTEGFEPYLPLCKRGALPIELPTHIL